jgi:hypothetical protein
MFLAKKKASGLPPEAHAGLCGKSQSNPVGSKPPFEFQIKHNSFTIQVYFRQEYFFLQSLKTLKTFLTIQGFMLHITVNLKLIRLGAP